MKAEGSRKALSDSSFILHPSSFSSEETYQATRRPVELATTLTPDAYRSADNRQDVGAVERVQQGVRSRAYPGGRMCFRFEEPVHRFQNMVIDLMTATERTPPGDPPTTEKGPDVASGTIASR